MARRKKLDLSNGEVAGYLRKSRVIYPDNCTTPEARAAFIEVTRRTRVNELIADAARDGERITRWYDDIGVSGRGEYIDKREAFAQLCDDAKHGRIRKIYARELSRLGRDFAGGELFYAEMDILGVVVSAADLPTVREGATDDEAISMQLTRRVLSAANQHLADQAAVRMIGKLRQKVIDGDMLGRTRSQWGLKYIVGQQRFEYDPETATWIIRLFERFVEFDGNANRLANALNAEILAGVPDALRPPKAATWRANKIAQMIRSRIWYGEVTWTVNDLHGNPVDEIVLNRRDRIPEVVPRGLLDRANALLAMRSAADRSPAKRQDYTYSGLIWCAHCGEKVRASRSVPAKKSGRKRGVVYCACANARESRALCPNSYGATQSRIDATMGQALQMAGRKLGALHTPPPVRARKRPKPAASIDDALRKLDEQEQRIQLMFANNIIKTLDALRKMLEPIEQRRTELLAAKSAEAVTPDEERDASALAQTWYAVAGDIEQLWKSTGTADMDRDKSIMLRTLGAKVWLFTHQRPRIYGDGVCGGKITLRVEFTALGLTGENAIVADEDDETYSRYSRGNHHRHVSK